MYDLLITSTLEKEQLARAACECCVIYTVEFLWKARRKNNNEGLCVDGDTYDKAVAKKDSLLKQAAHVLQ